MQASIGKLEEQLDSFEKNERKAALEELSRLAANGEISLPEPQRDVNLHCHTFFSYNSYGYSPSKYAWLARKSGVALAGTVDFDVLDGLDEFYHACELLSLKGCVGMETRVFISEFSDREINSPGEPGISYHMGIGFPTADMNGNQAAFLSRLRQGATDRNTGMVARVNKYLDAIALDYQKDVLPLTPAGNATERHICQAYISKAMAVFADKPEKLAAFWSEKLGIPADKLDLPSSVKLTNTLRAKTMKQGGVGYAQPGEGAFPTQVETNEFILKAGAIPTHTWLNGLSAGEKAIDELLDVSMSTGVAALNIIPDRNFTPGLQDEKLANLFHVVEVAEKRHLPVIVGTEMNSPGQKFIDAFETKELQGLVPIFLSGAYIVYAHCAMQRQCGLGYLSDWAKGNFTNVAKKNQFFEKLGILLSPGKHKTLSEFDKNTIPAEILEKTQK